MSRLFSFSLKHLFIIRSLCRPPSPLSVKDLRGYNSSYGNKGKNFADNRNEKKNETVGRKIGDNSSKTMKMTGQAKGNPSVKKNLRHTETNEKLKPALTPKSTVVQTAQVKPPAVANLAITEDKASRAESFRVEIEGPKVMVPSIPEVRKGTDRVVLAEGDRPEEVYMTDEAEAVPQPPPRQRPIQKLNIESTDAAEKKKVEILAEDESHPPEKFVVMRPVLKEPNVGAHGSVKKISHQAKQTKARESQPKEKLLVSRYKKVPLQDVQQTVHQPRTQGEPYEMTQEALQEQGAQEAAGAPQDYQQAGTQDSLQTEQQDMQNAEYQTGQQQMQPMHPAQQQMQPMHPAQQQLQPMQPAQQQLQPLHPGQQQPMHPAQPQQMHPAQQQFQPIHPAHPAQQQVPAPQQMHPAQQPMHPAQQPMHPAQQPMQPTQQQRPAQQPMHPVQQQMPAPQPMHPVQQQMPAQQPMHPVQQPMAPVQQQVPAQQPMHPAQQPIQPVHQQIPMQQQVPPQQPMQPVQQQIPAQQPMPAAQQPMPAAQQPLQPVQQQMPASQQVPAAQQPMQPAQQQVQPAAPQVQAAPQQLQQAQQQVPADQQTSAAPTDSQSPAPQHQQQPAQQTPNQLAPEQANVQAAAQGAQQTQQQETQQSTATQDKQQQEEVAAAQEQTAPAALPETSQQLVQNQPEVKSAQPVQQNQVSSQALQQPQAPAAQQPTQAAVAAQAPERQTQNLAPKQKAAAAAAVEDKTAEQTTKSAADKSQPADRPSAPIKDLAQQAAKPKVAVQPQQAAPVDSEVAAQQKQALQDVGKPLPPSENRPNQQNFDEITPTQASLRAGQPKAATPAKPQKFVGTLAKEIKPRPMVMPQDKINMPGKKPQNVTTAKSSNALETPLTAEDLRRILTDAKVQYETILSNVNDIKKGYGETIKIKEADKNQTKPVDLQGITTHTPKTTINDSKAEDTSPSPLNTANFEDIINALDSEATDSPQQISSFVGYTKTFTGDAILNAPTHCEMKVDQPKDGETTDFNRQAVIEAIEVNLMKINEKKEGGEAKDKVSSPEVNITIEALELEEVLEYAKSQQEPTEVISTHHVTITQEQTPIDSQAAKAAPDQQPTQETTSEYLYQDLMSTFHTFGDSPMQGQSNDFTCFNPNLTYDNTNSFQVAECAAENPTTMSAAAATTTASVAEKDGTHKNTLDYGYHHFSFFDIFQASLDKNCTSQSASVKQHHQATDNNEAQNNETK